MITLLAVCVYSVFIATLLVIALSDINCRRVPNVSVISLVALWALWRVLLVTLNLSVALDVLAESLASIMFSLVVLGALLGVSAVYEHVRKRPAMGMGDVKLIAVLALYLRPYSLSVCIMSACVVAIFFSVLNFFMTKDYLAERSAQSSLAVEANLKKIYGIPFASCLACGTLFALLAV